LIFDLRQWLAGKKEISRKWHKTMEESVVCSVTIDANTTEQFSPDSFMVAMQEILVGNFFFFFISNQEKLAC